MPIPLIPLCVVFQLKKESRVSLWFFPEESAIVLDLDRVKIVGLLLWIGIGRGMPPLFCSNPLCSGLIWNSSNFGFFYRCNMEGCFRQNETIDGIDQAYHASHLKKNHLWVSLSFTEIIVLRCSHRHNWRSFVILPFVQSLLITRSIGSAMTLSHKNIKSCSQYSILFYFATDLIVYGVVIIVRKTRFVRSISQFIFLLSSYLDYLIYFLL